MAGGNQSSSKRGYRNLKGGGQKAPDVRALSGSETFGDENNTQLFGPGGNTGIGGSQGQGNPLAEKIDTEYGISSFNETPNGGGYKGNANGYLEESADISGGIPSRESKPAKGANPEPGGGWE